MYKFKEKLPVVENEERIEKSLVEKTEDIIEDEKSDEWLQEQIKLTKDREERINEIKNRISKIEEETAVVKELVPELSKEVVDAKSSNKPSLWQNLRDWKYNIDREIRNPESWWFVSNRNYGLYPAVATVIGSKLLHKRAERQGFQEPEDVKIENVSVTNIKKNKINQEEAQLYSKLAFANIKAYGKVMNNPILSVEGMVSLQSPLLGKKTNDYEWRVSYYPDFNYGPKGLGDYSLKPEYLIKIDDYWCNLDIAYSSTFGNENFKILEKFQAFQLGQHFALNNRLVNNIKQQLSEYTSNFLQPSKYEDWSRLEEQYKINTELSSQTDEQIDQLFTTGLQTGEFDSLLLYIGDGAQKFLDITASEQYRLAGKEFQMLQQHKKELVSNIVNSSVYDLGPGDGHKAKELLRGMQEQNNQKDINYYPVDINPTMVYATADNFRDFPEVNINGLVCDFHKLSDKICAGKNSFLLLGNTIGNGDKDYQIQLLKSIRQAMKDGETLVIGAQLKTDLKEIAKQYNSPELSSLCKNIMKRFGVKEDELDYCAQADEKQGCVEMKLIFKQDRQINYQGVSKYFKKGDELKIVVSQKYELTQMEELLAASGLTADKTLVNKDSDYELVVARALAA